jgi:hypothetical protein
VSAFSGLVATDASRARQTDKGGILPPLGWAIMWAIGGYSLDQDWGTGSGLTSWRVPGVHWEIGGAFVLAAGSILIGIVLMVIYRAVTPPFFRGEVLIWDTMTLVPEDVGGPVGLFGIDPDEEESVPPE